MVKTTVYLEPAIALDLKHIATAEGRSQAELIREALAAYAAGYARKHKRPAIPGLGEFDSGHTDTSERAKEILRKAAATGKLRRARGAGR